MENVWHLFNNNDNNTSSGDRGHNNNHSTTHNHEWQIGNHLALPYNLTNNNATTPTTTTTTNTHCLQDGENYGTTFPHHYHIYSSSSSSSTSFGTSNNESGGSAYYHPDPHLPSLKLGKRHYFENANNNNNNNVVVIDRQHESEIMKKMKNLINGQEQFSWGGYGGLVWQPPSTSTAATGSTMAPRCQVEGCSVMLVDVKDYHKRHKVCEKHSKAPKVMVLGIEQRFCQQCSRFHGISEFDESKRSCRRRLAGHNERRRKSSQDLSAPKNHITPDKLMGGGCGYLPMLGTSSSAHSLMSSNKTRFINSSPDLSEQSSAALRELIVENRAALSVAWHVHDGTRHNSWRNHDMEDQIESRRRQNHRINCFSSEGMTGSAAAGCWEDMNNAGGHLSLEHQAGSL